MNQEKPEHDKHVAQNQEEKVGQDNQQLQPAQGTLKDVSVVGLGASAGGLDALKAFFAEVPETSGLAYIVLMHLSPDQPSMLPDLLQRVSRIPVTKAEDGQRIEPDHVYTVPSRKEISIYQGTIQLLDPAEKSISMPIDYFFRTLASDKKSNAAAIILSGTGSDGTVGLREIKDNEGLVLVQSKDTAKYDGMPASAIHTGLVDMVLAPQDMPQKLGEYFDHRHRVADKKQEVSQDQEWLNKIFALLRVQAGQDFSFYKTNTIHRRIQRRMVLNQIESKDTYLSFLRENPNEVNALFRELLIGVTNFFREPESFEVMKNKILPKVFKGLRDDALFRVWVPGCSSGEEVFSLAMVILEGLDQFPEKTFELQIFGSDIDQRAIDKARQGLYPSSIQADVSQERLSRFFQPEGDNYRIRKEIRDRVVFSVQNVLNDPPFSRLSLLSCRNLLIYLNSQAQRKLLPLFHYTLVPGGIMMLGSSESIGGFTNLFEPLDTTWKIYKRREVPQALQPQIDFPAGKPKEEAQAEAASKSALEPKADLEKETKNLVLERFAPAAVLVDSKGTILHIQGRTGKYLEPASGPPNQNILDMAREGLRTELSLAMRKALGSKEEILRRQVQIKVNGGTQVIDLHVFPVQQTKKLSGRLLIAFEDIESSRQDLHTRQRKADSLENDSDARIAELEQELQDTRENHQTTIEELESSNEELKSTNEELQSSNEELQSTNEELESSKEELQSLNEELKTVNSELQSKVDELSEAHDDITNLLNSTQIATIFVDNDLQVKRFSREATKIVNLIESDIGRPLAHQSTRLQDVDLTEGIKQVLHNLTPLEKEVHSEDGSWYIMRIMPYRTRDNRIQGAVVTFRDVDAQKKSQEKLKELNEELEQAWFLVRSVFDMNKDPLAVLDEQGRVVIANTALCRLLDLSMQKIEGIDIFSLDKADLRSTDLQSKLQSALKADKDFETNPFQLDTEQGRKTISLKGQVVHQGKKERPYRVLLQFVNR
jgi:two-component system CheB/CheR fusion protein